MSSLIHTACICGMGVACRWALQLNPCSNHHVLITSSRTKRKAMEGQKSVAMLRLPDEHLNCVMRLQGSCDVGCKEEPYLGELVSDETYTHVARGLAWVVVDVIPPLAVPDTRYGRGNLLNGMQGGELVADCKMQQKWQQLMPSSSQFGLHMLAVMWSLKTGIVQ
jgi:hypothetical protein